MRRTAALIIGGGPAGAAAAITLAQNGARPLLIERTARPQPIVCGGFTGWDAIARLRTLGIDPWALGAHPITRVRIVTRTSTIEARLPGVAAGLSRERLDAALLDAAAAAGVEVQRGIAVRALDDDGVAHLGDGTAIAADALFLATGKHEVRGHARRPGGSKGHVGLRSTLPGTAASTGTIELHPFAGGYAGLLVQEDGRANVCLSVSAARFAAAGGSIAALADALADESPALADLIAAADPDWAAIAGVPYGWRAHDTRPGRFRIGDQAAVIASVVGDGIAMALAGGARAGDAWLAGGGAAAPRFQQRFRRQVGRAITVAEGVRMIAERPAIAQATLPLLARAPGLVGLAARLTRCH